MSPEELSKEINQTIDLCNTYILASEVKAGEVYEGIRAEVEINIAKRQTFLMFTRIGKAGKFRIALCQPPGKPKPLHDCTRDLKLEAVTRIPDLFKALEKKTNDMYQDSLYTKRFLQEIS